MSNALLLRLFTSEFFNSWIAISYLFRYPDNVGIQHYLCNELKKFPMAEIEFFLPQLVHLLISRPSESVALEMFILDRCEQSSHFAILTLWYLQAYLSDLSSQPNSDSFKLCKRVTNKCQAIVFSDGSFSEEPDQETAAAISLGIPTHRVRENVVPAVVGIGALLAGIAQPLLTRQAGQIAIAQGRRNRALSVSGPSSQALARRNTTTGASRQSSQQQKQVGNDNDAASVTTSTTTAGTLVSETTTTTTITSQATTNSPPSPPRPSTPVQTSTSQPNLTLPKRGSLQSLRDFPLASLTASPSLEDLHRGKAFSVSRLVRSAQDKLSRTKLNRRSGSSSSSGVFDSALATMGRSSVPTTEASPLSPTLPAYSSEDNITHRGHRRHHHHHHPVSSSAATSVYSGSDSDSVHSRSGSSSGSGSDDDFSALSLVPLEHRRLLLKSNYFHSEMQFLLALVDISTRLVIVPKPARQSTLIAELTLLNHNLPAEICIPLWCPATTQRPYHHRVVRISPQDAVVLNSAERVPYLLMVEVLEDEMSFEDYTSLSHAQRKQRHKHKKAALKREEKRKEREKREKEETVAGEEQVRTDILVNGEKVVEGGEEMEQVAVAVMEVTEAETVVNRNGHGNLAVEPGMGNEDLKVFSASQTSATPSATPSPSSSFSTSAPQPPAPQLPAPQTPAESSPPPPPSLHDSTDITSPHPAKPLSRSPTSASIVRSPSRLSTVFTPAPDAAALAPSDSYFARLEAHRRSNMGDEFAERMRTAAIMLAQLQQQPYRGTSTAPTNPGVSSPPLGSAGTAAGKQPHLTPKSRAETDEIRQRIIKEMMALEEHRMMRMKTEGVGSGVGGSGGEGGGGVMLEDEKRVREFVDKEDPSAVVFQEDWEMKRARIQAASPYGHLPNWRLLSVIVKNGADLRQEQLALQLILEMQRVWQDAGVDVWVKYFRILVTSDNSGLIETNANAISIHSIKKDAYARRLNEKGAVFTLYDYFLRKYGDPSGDAFLKAQDAFMRSLAGYSIICYILQIKDRHNGNVLLDADGHLIHIDFGFMLSNSPGSVGFEMAPFKLPQEYLDLLGGVHSEKFAEYKALMKSAFAVLRKHCENIVLLIEMMQKDSKLPCFQIGEATVGALRDRFQLALTEPQCDEYVDKLIMSSCCNVFTRLYDTFQYYSQGIL